MTGCDVTIPGEGEGEGEGEPEPDKVTVLVEAYVAVGCTHCAKVEPILEQLAGEYNRDEMILVEVIPWGDYYDIPEAYQRYQWYGLTGGVPQITFNGLNSNILESQLTQSLKTESSHSYLLNQPLSCRRLGLLTVRAQLLAEK